MRETTSGLSSRRAPSGGSTEMRLAWAAAGAAQAADDHEAERDGRQRGASSSHAAATRPRGGQPLRLVSDQPQHRDTSQVQQVVHLTQRGGGAAHDIEHRGAAEHERQRRDDGEQSPRAGRLPRGEQEPDRQRDVEGPQLAGRRGPSRPSPRRGSAPAPASTSCDSATTKRAQRATLTGSARGHGAAGRRARSGGEDRRGEVGDGLGLAHPHHAVEDRRDPATRPRSRRTCRGGRRGPRPPALPPHRPSGRRALRGSVRIACPEGRLTGVAGSRRVRLVAWMT